MPSPGTFESGQVALRVLALERQTVPRTAQVRSRETVAYLREAVEKELLDPYVVEEKLEA